MAAAITHSFNMLNIMTAPKQTQTRHGSTMNTVETVEYRHMGQVVPRVWVGSLAALSHLDSRQGRKWTVISILSSNHIIKMTSDVLSHNSNVEEHVVWVLKDSAQAELLSEHHLPRVFEILNAAGSNSNETNDCLIHCAKGCSRSVSVCAAWLLHSRRYTSLQAALERIRRVRPNCNPNLGFVASLRALEQCNGDVSRARERLSRSSSVGERDRRDEGEIEVMTDQSTTSSLIHELVILLNGNPTVRLDYIAM